MQSPSCCKSPMARNNSARAGNVLLKGISPKGAISKADAVISTQLFSISASQLDVSQFRRWGRLKRSSRCSHRLLWFSPVRSFSVGNTRCAMHFGNHSLQPRSRLVPIITMAAPKTVLTPGIETGTIKTIARNAMRSNKPSCPTISLISASDTPFVGNCQS